jgi:hypothetical protein
MQKRHHRKEIKDFGFLPVMVIQKVYKIAVQLFTVKNSKGDFLEAVKNITRLFRSICHSISKIIERKWLNGIRLS